MSRASLTFFLSTPSLPKKARATNAALNSAGMSTPWMALHEAARSNSLILRLRCACTENRCSSWSRVGLRNPIILSERFAACRGEALVGEIRDW